MQQFTILFFLPLFAFCTSSTVIHLDDGDISGTTRELPNGRTVHGFYGVPYAAPPIHKLRFKEPQPMKSWTGVWNASTVPAPCLQYDQFSLSIVGEEDCLYLNIFTPTLPENGVNPLLDVVFYIHGGAFMFGSGYLYSPDYLMMKNDVVSVTFNYRLGPLGFLSTGDDVVPGNNGLKDQTAALKWVHRNIIKFGGNPASITIAGCSAGGASVHYHFLSPLSDGLFHKGISFSGTVLPPWTLSRNNTEKSIQLASLLGCSTTSSQDTVNCLRKRPGKQIVQMVNAFQPWLYNSFTPFGPTIEPESPTAFLSEEPIQLLTEGLVKDLPWLISIVKDEGLYPAADIIAREGFLQQLDSEWQDIAPHLFMYHYRTSSDEEKKAVGQAIKKYYFDNNAVSKNTFSNLVRALGDRHFFNDIIRAAEIHSSVNEEDVFCYLFNYRGKYSLTNVFTHSLEDYGTSHADDLMYVFNYSPANLLDDESDAAMVEYLTSVIGRFVKTGNPNSGKPEWQPLSEKIDNKLSCLFVNSPSEQRMGEVSRKEEIKFWKNVLPSEHPVPTDPTLKDEL